MRFEGHELRMQAGQGAHTPVYLARGPRGGSLVAIKLVPAGAPPALVQSLKRRFARACEHSQLLGDYKDVVKALDHGTAGGIPYLMMEGVQGSTLEQLLGRPSGQDPLNPRRPSPMPAQRAVQVLRRIVTAVGRLHQHRLIHRNLKPGNFFMARSDQGEVKVTDMGLAWLATSSGEGPPRLVTSPEVLAPSSVPYMSPELIRGDRSLKPCSDIYSIGVLAHEMVTGRLPYQVTDAMASGPNPAGGPDLSPDRWSPFVAGWLKAHLSAERVAVLEARPDLPLALGDLLDQCLARDPRDRIQSTGELIMQLALIEQDLARGPQSSIAVPAPAAPRGPELPPAPARPGAVSPVRVPVQPLQQVGGGSAPEAPPVGSLSKVINLASDRDRLTMEVNQLRAALQQAQADLATTRERLAAAQEENRRLRARIGRGDALPPEEDDSQRKTGRLPQINAPGSPPAMGGVVPGPVASNPFMKTELEGDLVAELERGARTGEPLIEDQAPPTRRRPATGPQQPPDFRGTGPVRPRRSSTETGSLLQTRFQETIPGSGQRPHPVKQAPAEGPGDMVDRLMRETSSASANMARQLKRTGKRTRPRPAQPDVDLDLMKTNILEGSIEEINTGEATSVVSEEDLLAEMKTRAVERIVPVRPPKKR